MHVCEMFAGVYCLMSVWCALEVGVGVPSLSTLYRVSIIHACFLMSRAACLRLELHSSYARPPPNPRPTMAGHDLRLNSSTEKTTPKPRPRVDFIRRLERQRSHCVRCQLVYARFLSWYFRRYWSVVSSVPGLADSRQSYLFVQESLADWSRDGARRWRRNGRLGHFGHLREV